jgi:ferrochelatase
MALRTPLTQFSKRAPTAQITKCTGTPVSSLWNPHLREPFQRGKTDIVPPVTQDATGSKGPTAIVFMNMGGPSTTDEVGSFLSRLFVTLSKHSYMSQQTNISTG